MPFGKSIQTERTKRGWSKEFVAIETGTTVASLNKYEAGLRNPPLKKAAKFAELFGKTVNELMGVTDEQVNNMVEIKLDPDSKNAIERNKRMKEASCRKFTQRIPARTGKGKWQMMPVFRSS